MSAKIEGVDTTADIERTAGVATDEISKLGAFTELLRLRVLGETNVIRSTTGNST
jgi:hypothetical protein